MGRSCTAGFLAAMCVADLVSVDSVSVLLGEHGFSLAFDVGFDLVRMWACRCHCLGLSNTIFCSSLLCTKFDGACSGSDL